MCKGSRGREAVQFHVEHGRLLTAFYGRAGTERMAA
jgi:hypothetical protein